MVGLPDGVRPVGFSAVEQVVGLPVRLVTLLGQGGVPVRKLSPAAILLLARLSRT